MNFLAHLYLAYSPEGQRNDEELLVGNFIADSVKGNQFELYSEGISKGILMHRAVDYFSDHNPIYLQSVHKLQPLYGKYSGVITDMFYDYFLALNWNIYSTVELKDFCNEMYRILSSHKNEMPEESRTILNYMIKNNWLYSYREIEGIQKALYGMSKRMKYYFPMDNAAAELEKSPSAYNHDFMEFFPLLMGHVVPFKNK
jgi:acyl carrier protein phosphodiesterase